MKKEYKLVLPNRKAQLAYHAELEKALNVRIVRVMGRWEICPPKKK